MDRSEALKVLNLTEGYTEAELKKRYRELVKQWHPDVNPSSEAEIMMQRINEAQGVLQDGGGVGGETTTEYVIRFRHTSFFDVVSVRGNEATERSQEVIKYRHTSFFDVCRA